jgi:hypothetical protein
LGDEEKSYRLMGFSKVSVDAQLDGEHKARLQSSLHSREDLDEEIPKTEMIKVTALSPLPLPLPPSPSSFSLS